ncbi:MAG: hypothetical protein MJ212_04645 [Alphaproteobacteria bacterium]|nr:hypothetical protein [Alphaproteobacteria bacterium]
MVEIAASKKESKQSVAHPISFVNPAFVDFFAFFCRFFGCILYYHRNFAE